MKKLTVLTLACLLILAGCGNRTMNDIIANEPSVTGIVTDIRNTGAAVITLPDGTEKEIFCGELI